MIRTASKNSPTYNFTSDIEYTEHLMVSILMFCGYEDFEVLNYSIDEVVDRIKEMLPTNTLDVFTAAMAIVEETKYRILQNYRDLWFNHQLARGNYSNA